MPFGRETFAPRGNRTSPPVRYLSSATSGGRECKWRSEDSYDDHAAAGVDASIAHRVPDATGRAHIARFRRDDGEGMTCVRPWLLAALVLLGAFPADAFEHATRLILLGTGGGPVVNPDRAQPASALVVRGTPYLVDAGNGTARQLSLAGIPLLRVHQIFISHNHDDHNADWGTLMGLAWSMGGTEAVTVYGPRGTESMRAGFLRYFAPNAAARELPGGANRDPTTFMLAREFTGPGEVYRDANVKVIAAENCHFHFAGGTKGDGWQQSFALRFETADRVVVFSGDTGPCADRLEGIAHGADILVHEVVDVAGIEQVLKQRESGADGTQARIEALMKHMRDEHSTPQEVGRLARQAAVKMVVLTHVIPGRASDRDETYASGVKQFYAGPVVVGRDLMEF